MGESFIPGLSVAQAALVVVGSLVLAGAVKETKVGKHVIIPCLIVVAVILVIYDAARERLPVKSASELAGIVAFSGLVGFLGGFLLGHSTGQKKS